MRTDISSVFEKAKLAEMTTEDLAKLAESRRKYGEEYQKFAVLNITPAQIQSSIEYFNRLNVCILKIVNYIYAPFDIASPIRPLLPPEQDETLTDSVEASGEVESDPPSLVDIVQPVDKRQHDGSSAATSDRQSRGKKGKNSADSQRRRSGRSKNKQD